MKVNLSHRGKKRDRMSFWICLIALLLIYLWSKIKMLLTLRAHYQLMRQWCYQYLWQILKCSKKWSKRFLHLRDISQRQRCTIDKAISKEWISKVYSLLSITNKAHISNILLHWSLKREAGSSTSDFKLGLRKRSLKSIPGEVNSKQKSKQSISILKMNGKLKPV